jgi:hypothetical protein
MSLVRFVSPLRGLGLFHNVSHRFHHPSMRKSGACWGPGSALGYVLSSLAGLWRHRQDAVPCLVNINLLRLSMFQIR